MGKSGLSMHQKLAAEFMDMFVYEVKKLRKRAFAYIVIMLILMLCGCEAEEKTDSLRLPVLKIGCDIYEPFNYTDDDGNYAGIDVELAEEACRRIGYTPEFVTIDWTKKNELLENGDIDCLWGCFSMEGREDDYTWAGPYMYSRQVVVVRRDEDIFSLADLGGKRISVQSSGKPEEILLKNENAAVPEVGEVYCFPDMMQVFASLKKGYADAAAAHESAVKNYIKGNEQDYRILDDALLVTPVGVAFSKNYNKEAAQKIDAALRQMRDDGFIYKTVEKFGLDADRAQNGRTDYE